MFAATCSLSALVQQTADHARPSAGDGFHGTAQPSFVRFMTSVSDGRVEAQRHVARVANTIDRYAIAWDGRIVAATGKQDAILIEAGEQGNADAAIYAFPYARDASGETEFAGERVLVETTTNALPKLDMAAQIDKINDQFGDLFGDLFGHSKPPRR